MIVVEEEIRRKINVESRRKILTKLEGSLGLVE